MAGETRIDWDWTRQSLIKSERLPRIKEDLAKKSIFEAAGESLSIAKALACPHMIAVKKRILKIKRGILKIEEGVELSSVKLSSFLKKSDHIYIFAVTIGKKLEKTATRYMDKGDVLHGYLLDRIGSFACESLAESVEDNLRKIYSAKNLSVSMRFSPGYCDWRIEEQVKLDKILNLSKIGIALNKNCMMIPKKSITAIVGIGPKGLFKKSGSQCGICDKKDCGYRRAA